MKKVNLFRVIQSIRVNNNVQWDLIRRGIEDEEVEWKFYRCRFAFCHLESAICSLIPDNVSIILFVLKGLISNQEELLLNKK